MFFQPRLLSLCFNFSESPDWVRNKVVSPRLISPSYFKLEVFEKEFGIDKTFYIKFSPMLQRMEPEEFWNYYFQR